MADVNPKRVLIVDYNHLAHTYMHTMAGRLTTTVNGEVVDTTITAMTVKRIFEWSGYGSHPTAICLDSPCPSRKAIHNRFFGTGSGEDGYKGDRAGMRSSFYDAISQFVQFTNGHISLFKQQGYEADDLILACVENARKNYPDHHIDIVTNDTDLLPLVSDDTSVFLRSMKGTWAESEALKKTKYMQFTPQNFTESVKMRSDYKDYDIPYNSILLLKLLRGDNSDNIPGDLRAFPPRMVKKLFLDMDPSDAASVFRFGNLSSVMEYVKTFVEDDELLKNIYARYLLMDLNHGYRSEEHGVDRPATKLRTMKQIDVQGLGNSLLKLGIHLPLPRS